MVKSIKEYKASYKTYSNDRIKQVLFHTKWMYPIYVQVTFDRIPIIFKSYYFDLFSHPKYSLRVEGRVYTPDIKEVIEREEALIAFIINKNADDFSLDLFKKEYAFYCRDLLSLTEPGFINYLYTFLHDEGLPSLADTIRNGAGICKTYDLIQDLRLALREARYQKLIDNSFYYATPYLALNEFIKTPKLRHLPCYTVMQWEQPDSKENFIRFFQKHFPAQNSNNAVTQIEHFVKQP